MISILNPQAGTNTTDTQLDALIQTTLTAGMTHEDADEDYQENEWVNVESEDEEGTGSEKCDDSSSGLSDEENEEENNKDREERNDVPASPQAIKETMQHSSSDERRPIRAPITRSKTGHVYTDEVTTKTNKKNGRREQN